MKRRVERLKQSRKNFGLLSSGGNSAAESTARIFLVSTCHLENLLSLNQPEILPQKIQRRKSTTRIPLVSTCHALKLWSGGNSAAEIHSENFGRSNCSAGEVVIIWRFCCGNLQQEFP